MITKLRASKITIETPSEGSVAWVHIQIQKVFKDNNGNTTNVIPRYDYISVPLHEIGMNFYNGFDPVTQENHNISGYGSADLISSIVIELMKEKYGGELDEVGNLII